MSLEQRCSMSGTSICFSEALFCAMLHIASAEEKLCSTISDITPIVTQNLHCKEIISVFQYSFFLITKVGFLNTNDFNIADSFVLN